jgi:Flp pilus assembly protein TadB
MSRLKAMREEANRESDPEIRRRRIAELDKIEAEVRDADKRLAAVNAKLADLQSGRQPFFSWIEFVGGLGVVGALVGSLYFRLSSLATVIVVIIVVAVIAGIVLLRIKRRLKNLDRSA